MARPLKGKNPIDVSFNCKLTENENSQLSSLAFSTGFTKSEVVRRMIKFAYVMVADEAFNVRKEEEKEGVHFSMLEMQQRLLQKLEDKYMSLMNFDNLGKDDALFLTMDDDVPLKMAGIKKRMILDDDKKLELASLSKNKKTLKIKSLFIKSKRSK